MLFAFRLAAHLGIEDPIAMISRMTPEQLNHWIAFDAIEPLGMRGVYWQLANLLAADAAKVGVEPEFSELFPGLRGDD